MRSSRTARKYPGLSRKAENQARERRLPATHSILLLDLSGSILNNADLPRLKEAATTFIDRAMPQEGESLRHREMAVYWFDGEQNIHRLWSPSPPTVTA
ncbi:MAG: hypothetical protein U5K69_22065 [Balneolaceae bacterium]|nr:hypothetical protein [Balneolaceae bacterium]